MFLSYINILIKVGAILVLFYIFRAAKANVGSVTAMK
jgi:hypothetical protein